MIFDPRQYRPDHWLSPKPEEGKKEKKPFQHRQAVSKCPRCANRGVRGGKAYCLASGEPIKETSGCNPCAYVEKSDG